MPDVMFAVKDYHFIYDSRKGALNRQKHGIRVCF